MSPLNHLHLDPFLSSYPPQSSPSLVSSPPNYQHELIVASDGWRRARKLPVSHHHPIIVVVQASLSCCAACRHAARCRRRAAVAPLSLAVVVPPVAVLVPRRRAARHLLCSLAANRRNWTLPSLSGVAHDE
jgi:hypothetical protein